MGLDADNLRVGGGCGEGGRELRVSIGGGGSLELRGGVVRQAWERRVGDLLNS